MTIHIPWLGLPPYAADESWIRGPERTGAA
jgi:hypothetical protein